MDILECCDLGEVEIKISILGEKVRQIVEETMEIWKIGENERGRMKKL